MSFRWLPMESSTRLNGSTITREQKILLRNPPPPSLESRHVIAMAIRRGATLVYRTCVPITLEGTHKEKKKNPK